ncbi:MarR family transcriptional regulator [Paraoerskovia marina]|uniref:MarR family transcriptional regulator n=1 Tax=Paraoerskovia marina TaxID=545619 RepID=UPI0012DFE397|nr:MarR family transcriptional regulator [Paraoerskovia marina]
MTPSDQVRRRLAAISSTTLTMQQLRVLAILHAHDPQRATELANRLQVSAATTSGILDRLEAGGYLERRQHELDGRARAITLTPRGRASILAFVD